MTAPSDRRTLPGIAALIGYALTIPAANWLIEHVDPIPVDFGLFGLFAPAGILAVGFAPALRDAVHETLGRVGVLVAIALGVGLSILTTPDDPKFPNLVFASAFAFALAELVDWVVYSPLRKRDLLLAVGVSGAVALVVDSVIFLLMAFGSLDFLLGQIVGKTWAVLAALAVIMAWRRARARRTKGAQVPA